MQDDTKIIRLYINLPKAMPTCVHESMSRSCDLLGFDPRKSDLRIYRVEHFTFSRVKRMVQM